MSIESGRPRRRGGVVLILSAIFLVGLAPRLYSALVLGWGWDAPGSFTLVNFDEGGSCRAALGGFEYATFVGHQTIAISSALGHPPPPGTRGNPAAAKAYCHSPKHLRVARVYSAITGALTPVLLGVTGLYLVRRRRVGLTAAALLALSGFHISESHSGTVDAPSVFFIYLFLALLVAAVAGGRRALGWVIPGLLVAAVWAKYWVFAVVAGAGVLPRRCLEGFCAGWTPPRLALALVAAVMLFGCLTNTDFPPAAYPVLGLFYPLVPWRGIARPAVPLWLLLPWVAWGLTHIDLIATYTTGAMQGRFGTSYGAIGWHKWLRNLLNLPWVLVAGLGLPACLCLPWGLRAVVRERDPQRIRGWLCLLPVAVFALFMLVPAPVTYYRHYLPLLPAAALLAALGYWHLPPRWAKGLLLPFLLWPALLAFDLEADYHNDPRIALRQWYAERHPQRVLTTYYVNPPAMAGARHRLFLADAARGGAAGLGGAQYLVLSENWYDTAFANELNGPLVGDPRRLVKTTPSRARFYRRALAGDIEYLELERALVVENFMPELRLHKRWYGTFQLFVGDILVYRIVRQP